MRKAAKYLVLFVVGWFAAEPVILGLASWGPIRLPFGYTLNFAPGSGEPVAGAAFGARIRVPRGFTMSTWAEGIANARFLRFTGAGDLIVSAPRQGKVFLVERDGDGDGRADGVRVLLDELDRPHGLALRDGWLYVAETGAVLRVRFDADARSVSGSIERIVTDIPPGGGHWTRTIGFGPDGGLYVSVGSTCNVCIEENAKRATILRYEADGSGGRVFAGGLRNAVGFAWHPQSGDLYATDNGRDLLGDDFPPCELNRVVDGGFYGWPFVNGDGVADPDYGDHPGRPAQSIPPVFGFRAHNAPLGITFYDGKQFPERYRNAAFVALHGSWNRSEKDGYKVVAVWVDGGEARAEDFVVGFEEDEDVIGRPVDVAVGPDGALYVSDDFTGSIYRVAWGESAAAAVAPAPAVAAGADPLAGIGAERLAAARAEGAALWEKHACAACHLPGAQTTDVFRALEALGSRYDVATLDTYLHTPQPPMPAFALSDAERRDLAIYLLDRFR